MQLRTSLTVSLAALVIAVFSAPSVEAQAQQTKFNQPGNPPGNEAPFPPPDVQAGSYSLQRPYPQQGSVQGQGQPNMMQGQPNMMQGPANMMQGPPNMMQGQGMMQNSSGMQGQGMMPQNGQMQANQQAAKANPQQAAKVFQWFLSYDEVRRRAQMNPIEKQRADGLLARGFGLFMPGQDKLAAKQLLTGLVERYQTAAQAMRSIKPLPETKQLQEAYFQYFETAMQLFSDYLKVQDNVFAVDNTGQSIAKQLIQRKMMLENLEHSCKDLDYRIRQTYGVAPYQY